MTSVTASINVTIPILGATSGSAIALAVGSGLGPVPPGMAVSSSLRQITGAPTTAGTYDFSLDESLAGYATRRTALSITVTPASTPTPTGPLMGVNIAGAEFGGIGFYETDARIDYFFKSGSLGTGLGNGKGLGIARVPFLWERVQPTLNGSLVTGSDITELQRMGTRIVGNGAVCLFEVHNYLRRDIGGTITPVANDTTSALNKAHLADLCVKAATALIPDKTADSKYWFGIDNEPYGLVSSDIVAIMNYCGAALRAAGFNNKIIVSGNNYSAPDPWEDSTYATTMLDLGKFNGSTFDSNCAIDIHKYFDPTGAGDPNQVLPHVISPARAYERVSLFTTWALANGRKGLMGEFGALVNNAYDEQMTALLDHIAANPSVWVGATYWAAGAAWGDYPYSVEPAETTGPFTDKHQLEILYPYLNPPVVRPFNTLSLSDQTFARGSVSIQRIQGLLPGDTVAVSGSIPAGFTFNSSAKTVTFDGSGASRSATINLTTTNSSRPGGTKASAIVCTVADMDFFLSRSYVNYEATPGGGSYSFDASTKTLTVTRFGEDALYPWPTCAIPSNTAAYTLTFNLVSGTMISAPFTATTPGPYTVTLSAGQPPVIWPPAGGTVVLSNFTVTQTAA